MINRLNYLRISVTDRCNLRCGYCEVNPSAKLSPDDILSFEEIARFAGLAAKAGVRTVRVTGGEPLVRNSVASLFKMLASTPGIEEVTFTTNGVCLDRHAEAIYAAGVRRFNLSLDTLDPGGYSKLTGGGNVEKVIANLETALRAGFSNVKLNVVALRGINDGEIFDFLDFAAARGLTLRFIELMDISASAGDFFKRHFMPVGEIKKIIASRYPLSPLPSSAGECGLRGAGPAVYHSYGGGLKVGFISPVTNHFCDSCNRLRLTANGMLKSCLLRAGETDVKKMLRSGATDEDIVHTILSVFERKDKARGEFSDKNIMFSNMSQIGG